MPAPPKAGIAAPTYALSGWIEAVGFVIAIGVLSLVYAVGNALGAHPIAFILYAMTSAAVAMLAYAGLGSKTWAIMRHPTSWVIGTAVILVEVLYYVTITYVPPAHGNLVLRISVPISMAAGWVVLRRRPPALAVLGGIVIVAATACVVALTAPGVRWPMTAAGVLAGGFMVVRGFASEFHPPNRAARTVRDKLRVTGTVVLITSLLGIALAALAAGAIAAGAIPRVRFVPSAADLLHAPTILLGCLAGGATLMMLNYLSFSSVVKISTENFMAMMAFSPLATWAFQALGDALGWIRVEPMEPRLLAAMCVFVASVLLIIWAGRRARRG